MLVAAADEEARAEASEERGRAYLAEGAKIQVELSSQAPDVAPDVESRREELMETIAPHESRLDGSMSAFIKSPADSSRAKADPF